MSDQFQTEVRHALKVCDGRPVLNSTIEHAAILVEEMVRHASRRIKLLSSRLDTACYAKPAVIDACRGWLADPDNEMEILVETSKWDTGSKPYDWKSHPLFDCLQFHWNQIKLRQVPLAEVERYEFNFMLMDDRGFRFEADRNQPVAVAGFFKAPEKRIKNLTRIFSHLWNASTPYSFRR